MSQPPIESFYPGLEGVIAAETAVSSIEGRDGTGLLEYRGYRIEGLAARVGYEETAFLLLHGDLPDRRQLREFDGRLRSARGLPDDLKRLLTVLPRDADPMDVLRTAVSILSHFDPDRDAPPTDHAANVRKAERLIAQMATAVACRERVRQGLTPVEPDPELGHAANFLFMAGGKAPSPRMCEAFDSSLVLYAEHELNASTFSARVTVSTLSDIHSGIVAAIGTLKGPLHGGANEEAWRLLESVGSPENAAAWVDRPWPGMSGSWASATGFTSMATRARRSSRLTALTWPGKWVTTGGSGSPSRSSRPWSPASGCRPTSTGRAPGFIITWAWTSACTRPFSPWHGWRDGRLIASSRSTTIASCGRRGRYIGPIHRGVPPIDER